MQVKWHLRRSDIFYDERNLFIWSANLNSEWSIVCGCQEKPYIPDLIEIHRNLSMGNIWISGSLELFAEDGNKSLVKKNFFQLLENDYSFIRMNLKYSHNFTECPRSFLIIGNITVFNKNVAISLTCDGDLKEKDLVSETGDLLNFWYSNFSLYADIYLQCGPVCIPVHKSVLFAYSPVFASMSKNITNQKTIYIDDADPPTVLTMLICIYTGRIDNLNNTLASNLLIAADKYQLKQLKTVCSNYLKHNLNINNVIKSIVLGNSIDPSLKEFCVNFLSENDRMSEVGLTKEYQDLLKNDFGLAREILYSTGSLHAKKLEKIKKLEKMKELKEKLQLT